MVNPQPRWTLLQPRVSILHELPSKHLLRTEIDSHLKGSSKNFLLENWDNTDLGKEWAIYSSEDDLEAGNQFPHGCWAYRHTSNSLSVRTQGACYRTQAGIKGTDTTVGQILRYIGWVEKHFARPNGKTVGGANHCTRA